MTPHGHDHPHDAHAYHVGQLSAIGICGALGAVAILWYLARNMFFLAQPFAFMVLIGGIVLLAVVGLRAVSLWIDVGKRSLIADHHHEHDHCDHGHDHEHNSAPWRYTVLLLPIVLFLMNLPNTGFTSGFKRPNFEGMDEARGPGFFEHLHSAAKSQMDRPMPVGFLELEEASYRALSREYFTGKTVQLVGELDPIDNKRLFLFRRLMVHCPQDSIRIDFVIDCGEELSTGALKDKWVEATGRVSFRKWGGGYKATLYVPNATGLKVVPHDPRYFLTR